MAEIAVTGKAVLPDVTGKVEGATLIVQLEDTNQMDVAARVIGTSRQSVNFNGAPIDFTVIGELPEGLQRVGVRAHLSMNGDHEFDKGDYITKQSYTVSVQNHPEALTLNLNLEAV